MCHGEIICCQVSEVNYGGKKLIHPSMSLVTYRLLKLQFFNVPRC